MSTSEARIVPLYAPQSTFVGCWNAHEESAVTTVIAQVETTWDSWMPDVKGERWVCIRNETPEHTQYVAHRFGLSKIFKADTATRLGACIQEHFRGRFEPSDLERSLSA